MIRTIMKLDELNESDKNIMESLVDSIQNEFKIDRFDINIISTNYFGYWTVWNFASVSDGIYVIPENPGRVNIKGASEIRNRILLKDGEYNIIFLVASYAAEKITDDIIALDNENFYKLYYGIIQKKGYINKLLPKIPTDDISEILLNYDIYGFNYRYPNMCNYDTEINIYKTCGTSKEIKRIDLCHNLLKHMRDYNSCSFKLDNEIIDEIIEFCKDMNLKTTIERNKLWVSRE